MKKEAKNLKKDYESDIDYTNCKQVMSSNLPLLFANGQPRSLETISQPELEEFVPFMVRCSLGQEILNKPKEINNCPAPEWWPQGFPFKFPLVEQNDWINRLVMLKSLVCRCYTFYDCEFLLKFSSELAEISPSHLRFDENKEENTTSIFDANGCMLVKCRNENLNYDMHKNRRRYLSPAHRSSLNQAKKFVPVIDLTFDTSSEDEKEVYFKETAPPAAGKSGKRKTSVDQNEEPTTKQRCVRRVFDDFPMEEPEPIEHTQEQYMAKFKLIPLGKQIRKEVLKVERKKRLSSSFNILSISSHRGQELLVKNRHSINLETCLERIDRFCGSCSQEDTEPNQIYTRAAAVFSAMLKQDEEKKPEEEKQEEKIEGEEASKKEKWCHSYKWPHRTHNPVYPYMGPTVKPCTVLLNKLPKSEIIHWTKRRHTVATTTPDEWWSSEMTICKCQKIPLVVLDDEISSVASKFKDKKSSTRCTCNRSKSQIPLASQGKKSLSEVKTEMSSEFGETHNMDSSMKARNRTSNDSTFHRGGGFGISGSSITRSGIQPVSINKEGLSVITYDSRPQNSVSLNIRKMMYRRPLAVVPPSPVAVDKSVSDILCQPATCLPHHIVPSTKINFSRSILDAIKWYTKDDPALQAVDVFNESLTKEELKTNDPFQENIKPSMELSLPNLVKPIDYFQQNLNAAEYDYCFKRTSDGNSKLVTRRGERHYVNREPCPSCFQGRDNFCVYEFVRQARLAGLVLQENKKNLQMMFFKFIIAVNRKL